MTIEFDSHTHTVMSGHAFSTIEEYVAACKAKGLTGFASTDHGPAMEGAARLIYFFNLPMLPRQIDGIRILRGVEANIIDYDGRLDVPADILKTLDVCIASYHGVTLRPAGVEEHTRAWIKVVENPLVDILGHSGRGNFPYDIDRVMAACREQDTAVEINSHTLKDKCHEQPCRDIALACMRAGVRITINSDAHLSRHVGEVSRAMALLESIDFPAELIVNRTYETYKTWLSKRKPWLEGL